MRRGGTVNGRPNAIIPSGRRRLWLDPRRADSRGQDEQGRALARADAAVDAGMQVRLEVEPLMVHFLAPRPLGD